MAERITYVICRSPPDNKNPVWGRAKYILKTHKEIKWLEKHVAKAEEVQRHETAIARRMVSSRSATR